MLGKQIFSIAPIKCVTTVTHTDTIKDPVVQPETASRRTCGLQFFSIRKVVGLNMNHNPLLFYP